MHDATWCIPWIPMKQNERDTCFRFFLSFSMIYQKKTRKIIKDPSCHSCHGVFFKKILYHSSHNHGSTVSMGVSPIIISFLSFRGPIFHWTIHDYGKGKLIGGFFNPSDKYHRQIGFIFPNFSGWTFPKIIWVKPPPSEKFFRVHVIY